MNSEIKKIISLGLLFTFSACLYPGKSGLVFKPKTTSSINREPTKPDPVKPGPVEPEPNPDSKENEGVKFEAIKASILVPKCNDCHQDFSEEKNILVRKRIKPGNPEESEFFKQVESGQMPMLGEPLPTEELELIRSYITSLKPTKFDVLSAKILEPHGCVNCHGKRFETEETLMKWINVANPEESRFYARSKDGTMPPQGKGLPLTQEQQDFILEYIKEVSRQRQRSP